jgi:hypothetical protein
MKRVTLLLFVLILSPVSYGQKAKPNLLRDLLDLPSPPPVDLKKDEERERPDEFYDIKNIPPDDAPIEDLIDYWTSHNSLFNNLRYSITPSEKSLQRILYECRAKPELFLNFLNYLPKTSEFAAYIKQLYDEEKQKQETYNPLSERLKDWLKYNSNYFSNELYSVSQKVKDGNQGNTENEDELMALARYDWEKAKPILERLENDTSQPISVVSAKWILYQHALDAKDDREAERYRKQLKAIVENKNLRPSVRDKAMDALVLTPDWQGRDDWYLSLLEDETLFDLEENGQWYTGLTTLVSHTKGDKWISKMVKLVKSGNPTTRNAAARNLASLLYRKEREVIEALLPWLANPSWAKEANSERLDLIHALGENDFPGSVPDLILVLTTEDDGDYQLAAAKVLTHYKDSRAVPALRALLQKTVDEETRATYIKALIECNGFSDDEQLSSLEAYSTMISTEKGSEKFYETDEENPLPLPVSIGHFLSEQKEPGDGLVLKVIERLKTLKKISPDVAKVLMEIMRRWQSRVVDLEMLNLISDNKANVEIVVTILARREKLRKRVPNEIATMITKGGVARGVAAVLLGDKNVLLDVLSSHDDEAKIAVFSCARLVRAKLSLRDVASYLNDENKLLALAAERYLESEDSTEARSYVLEKHPNEALILGARNAFVPNEKATSFEALDELFANVSGTQLGEEKFSKLRKAEDGLRAEFKTDADLVEIYASLVNEKHGHRVVRVYKNKAVLTWYEDEARYREITLSEEELNFLRRQIEECKAEESPPILGDEKYPGNNGTEFVKLNRNGGRRVFVQMNANIPKEESDLFEEFENLSSKGSFKLFYYFARDVKGLEVLLADNRYEAKTLWKNGSDFRVLIEDKNEKGKSAEELRKEAERIALSEDDPPEVRREKMQNFQMKMQESEYAHFSWRKFENGKLGDVVQQPKEVLYFNESFQSKTKDFEIRIRHGGLFKVAEGQNPVFIKEGYYSSPIVTPDGNWVVAMKYSREDRLDVVRINLQTNKEFKIATPPKMNAYPIAFVSSHNKILIGTYKRFDESEIAKFREEKKVEDEDEDNSYQNYFESANYYLLNANTGLMQPAKGEVRPLTHQRFRSLQPTGNADEFWATINDRKTTEIGRYNAKIFSFKSLIKISNIIFNSMDLWVDEKERKVFFIYQGHLLSLPLPQSTKMNENRR